MKYSTVEIAKTADGELYVKYRDNDGDRVETKSGNMLLGYETGFYHYPIEFGKEKALQLLKESLINDCLQEIEELQKCIAKVKAVQ